MHVNIFLMHILHINSILVHVPLDEILSVKKLNGRKGAGFEVIGFAVCYIKHQKKYLLKQETVQFLGSSEDCEQWSKKIQDALDQGKYSHKLAFDCICFLNGK